MAPRRCKRSTRARKVGRPIAGAKVKVLLHSVLIYHDANYVVKAVRVARVAAGLHADRERIDADASRERPLVYR